MNKSKTKVPRSFDMVIVAYYLARCGERSKDQSAKPPKALNAMSWNEAYHAFYDATGDGRTLKQFHNSIKTARDVFDTKFDNGRKGWVNKGGQPAKITGSFERVYQEWEDRPTDELEAFVLGLQRGYSVDPDGEIRGPIAKTEGGKKVFVSVRPERDGSLRKKAIDIHGYDCMACGFNFNDVYGDAGNEFIEVHHVIPLSEEGERKTDPETDLIVLCANCHRVVHHQKNICLSLRELKEHLSRASLRRRP